MRAFKQHAQNIFKILALIIISSELLVLRLLICPSSLLERTSILPLMPTILEYVTVSIVIYIVGFIIWCFLESRLGRD